MVADSASLLTADGTRLTVEKGRWFARLPPSNAAVVVPVWSGEALQRGWLARQDVKPLAESDVDLAREALRLNKLLRPALDVDATLVKMHAALRGVTNAVPAGGSVKERAQRLSERLFGPEGFRVGKASALDLVLDGKRGNCLGLSVVYLCAARRAGLPARLVTAPKHVFVQIGDGKERFFVETTQGGRLHDATDYLRKHLGEQAMREAGGLHLEPLSAPQAVAVLRAELGRTLRDAGEYTKAVPHYARAAEILPRHAEISEGLGAALIGAGKLDIALPQCTRATELNPKDPEARCTLGVVLRRLGRHADACHEYQRAVEIRPRYARAWCNWGVALERLGRLDAARRKYARCTEINPKHADAWFNWGVVLAREGKHAEACEKFERTIALRPRDADALRYWGTLLLELGRDADGRDKLERARKLQHARGGRVP